jgi:two-component system phosphate regulon sensor histidine kinase PhoR
MKNRLFFKQFGIFLIIGILAFLIAGYFIEKQITGDMRRIIEENLFTQTRIIALMRTDEIVTRSKHLSDVSHARITLIDAAGNVVADSDGGSRALDNHLNRPEIQESRLKGKGSAIRYSRTLKVDMLYVALPLYTGKEINGYIRLALPLYQVSESVNQFRYTVTHIFFMIIVLSMLGALAFSLKVTAPILEMVEFTEKVKKGDVSGTMIVHSRDEIGRLAGNINEMVEALQEKITAAQEEQEKLRSAFASMSEGVMVLDADNRIEAFNRSMRKIIGDRYGDIVGKTILEAFRSTALHDAIEQVRRTNEPILQEMELGDAGKVLDVNLSIIKAPPGQMEKVMLVFHDVTRLKQLECVRADFVANVTHEIKTPLTAIIGFVETLQHGALNDTATAQKFLHIIHDHALRLNRLVDDLLTLSKIELGETRLQIEPLAVDHLMDSVLAVVQPRAEEKNLQIIRDFSGELPPLRADRDKISQIMLNILDNAVKFTPEGGRITITAMPSQDDQINIRISDTGIGIPKDEISRLGERFYRVDKTRSREMGGTGLGLSIVKHLLIICQGRMEIESKPGTGTTVSIFIPLSPTISS